MVGTAQERALPSSLRFLLRCAWLRRLRRSTPHVAMPRGSALPVLSSKSLAICTITFAVLPHMNLTNTSGAASNRNCFRSSGRCRIESVGPHHREDALLGAKSRPAPMIDLADAVQRERELADVGRGRHRLQRAHARQIGLGGGDRHAPVDHGAMKLLEHEPEGRQVAFLDRAVVVALQRFPQASRPPRAAWRPVLPGCRRRAPWKSSPAAVRGVARFARARRASDSGAARRRRSRVRRAAEWRTRKRRCIFRGRCVRCRRYRPPHRHAREARRPCRCRVSRFLQRPALPWRASGER